MRSHPTYWRKKPVVIEAMQVLDEPDLEGDLQIARIVGWMMAFGVVPTVVGENARPFGLKIPTLEGSTLASPGDWVIKGVQGEFYACKPDIFAATYEEAERPARPGGNR